MTMRELLCEALKQRGYDGLYSDGYDCACEIADLMPCEEPRADCQAGYKAPCKGGDECPVGGGCPFHIVAQKPVPEGERDGTD
jgi:hypothetical protein